MGIISSASEQMWTYRLEPPYTDCIQLDGMAPTSRTPGTIIAVRPGHGCDWSEVAQCLEHVEQLYLTASVALWTDLLPRETIATYASRARVLGVCGVLTKPIPAPSTLRNQLTDWSDLPVRMIRWLRISGLPIDHHAAHALQTMMIGTTQRRTLAGVRRDRSVGRRSWHKSFRRLGLGTPGRWFEVFYAIRVFLTVQTHPQRSVEKTAEVLGYGDAAAMRRIFRKYLGMPPSVVREHLGWKWMMHRALQRVGVAGQRQDP